MSPLLTNGFAAKEIGASLEPISYVSPTVGECDVRVAITHCGVCHTDVHAIDDYFGITNFPFVPGHEVVGFVQEAGREVTGLKEGDRVGIGWQGRACGHCEWCQSGEEHLCRHIDKMGAWDPYGGFASSIVVDSRFTYGLPPRMSSAKAAPLMCAGLTAYSALRPHRASAGKRLAIVGIGGLGHLGIQFARALGFEVTAVSSKPDKEADALALGANHFLLADTASLGAAQFDFDLLLCTASTGFDWVELIDLVTKNGTFILASFPDVAFNSTDFVAHQVSLTGAFLGSPATMREMLLFAHEHNIEPVIELMPMSRVNEALGRVKSGKPRYRIVLVNDESDVAS